jgi:hypothetical protein
VCYGSPHGSAEFSDRIGKLGHRASGRARLVSVVSAQSRELVGTGIRRVRKCANWDATISELFYEPEWDFTISGSAALAGRRCGLSRRNQYGRLVEEPNHDRPSDRD